jgi:hypothetical protein
MSVMMTCLPLQQVSLIGHKDSLLSLDNFAFFILIIMQCNPLTAGQCLNHLLSAGNILMDLCADQASQHHCTIFFYPYDYC